MLSFLNLLLAHPRYKAPPVVVTWHKNANISSFVLDFGAFNINGALATQSRVRVGYRAPTSLSNTGQIADAFAKGGQHHAFKLMDTFGEPLIQILPQLSGTFAVLVDEKSCRKPPAPELHIMALLPRCTRPWASWHEALGQDRSRR